MKSLVREAIAVSEELDGVIFVGAVARYFHTRTLRESADIDVAMGKPITKEELTAKGYKTFLEGRKEVTRTPRGVKIDIFAHDVSGIPIDTIKNTSVLIQGGNHMVRVIGLEALLVAKHRSQRDQDIEDIRELVRQKHDQIRLDILRQIVKSEVEYRTIITVISFWKGK